MSVYLEFKLLGGASKRGGDWRLEKLKLLLVPKFKGVGGEEVASKYFSEGDLNLGRSWDHYDQMEIVLSDCNWTRTQNHLVCKRTLNHLAKLTKWLSCVLSTYLYGAFDCISLSCHVRVSEPCSKQAGDHIIYKVLIKKKTHILKVCLYVSLTFSKV